MFQLKKGQEAFTVVEGPFAGKSFASGKLYAEIPPGTAERFTEIKEEAAPDPDPGKPAKAAKRGGVDAPESGEVKT